MLRVSRSAFRASHSVLAACLLLFTALQAAAQPANDRCQGAINIPFPTNSLPTILDGATTVGDPPMPPPATSFDTNITHSVWYKFTPADSGLYTISTGYDTDTTFKDTTMVMYTAANDCTNFTIYAYNEDSGTLRAAISTNLTAGTTYYIVVWIGRTEVFTSGLEVQVRITKPVVPVNDTCANAFVIPPSISTNYLTPVVDTTLATTTAGIAAPPCVTNLGAMPSRDVWYQFTPTIAGTYIFSTHTDTATRIEDTSIELYTLPGGNCNAPNQVACNDNSFGRARFSFDLTAGETYYLAVYDNATNYIPGETDLQLRITPAMAPTVVTLPPSSISSTGAALNGTITANGVVPTRFWFEWGPTTSLGSSTKTNFIFNRDLIFNTNLVVSGYAPGILYHYRMVGSNALGRSEGQLQTFLWDNTPPQIAGYGFDPDLGEVFNIDFSGAANHLYVVQGSTNLVDWTNLGRANELSPTSFRFQHSATVPVRFYRVRQP
jgi:hypothetical protein